MECISDDYVKEFVSVITPVYNCEKYIERTLNLVFAQKISRASFRDFVQEGVCA